MNTKRLAALAAVLLAGCLDSPVTECANGDVCPANKVCAPAGGCADADQVDACIGLTAGDSCDLPGVGAGECRDGLCIVAVCGDGIRDVSEACDDGNTDSGDGCRGDCMKEEECGDEIVDANETCDDANDNPADGCDACVSTEWTATALAGEGAQAVESGLVYPIDTAIDLFGNVYIADETADRVFRVSAATGVMSIAAGNGESTNNGDGGQATAAGVFQPHSVAVDGLGDLYIAHSQRVRRVDMLTGIVTTVAGGGDPPGGVGDGGPATAARIATTTPTIAVDGFGNLFIGQDHRVRRVDAGTGLIDTVAGTGLPGFSGDGGPATSAQLSGSADVALDGEGNLYIADQGNRRIRFVDMTTGVITTVAGTGQEGDSGDGEPAVDAQLSALLAIAAAPAGIYIADAAANRVRLVDAATGIISAVAGTGVEGFAGDGGPALAAWLNRPYGVGANAQGDLWIADLINRRVRRVDASTSEIATVAGDGTLGRSGDGGAATSAQLVEAYGVAIDSTDRLLIADTANFRVRRVDGAGHITTVAGTGINAYAGDGGPATSARIGEHYGVAVDSQDNIYIADTTNHCVRRVDAMTGEITTIAGTGAPGYLGDTGLATDAELSSPNDVAVDGDGNVYIADTDNNAIRVIDAITGIITRFAGSYLPGPLGDDGSATAASLSAPRAVELDGVGNVYIADTENNRIRRVDTSGTITTVAGTGVWGSIGDGFPATSAQLAEPCGVAIDPDGNLFISDWGTHQIRRVDAMTGRIDHLAGSTTNDGFLGDGGDAAIARLAAPCHLALDSAGDLYIADTENYVIRRIDGATNTITTVAGLIDPPGMGSIPLAAFATPRQLALGSQFAFVGGGETGTVQALRRTTDTIEVVAGRYPMRFSAGDLARYRAGFGDVHGVAFDATAGILYLSETAADSEITLIHAVTLVDPADQTTWTIAPVAGDGTSGFADGPAASARFRKPTALLLDEVAQILYVADTGNHVVRAIDLAESSVSTVVGTPATLGFFGDEGPADQALLYQPRGLAFCTNGDLLVADTGNHRVRRVSGGIIDTVLGDGVAASSGAGSPADGFPVNTPLGMACDGTGNLFVTSSTAIRMAVADELGAVDGSGSVQTIFAGSAGLPAYCLGGLAHVDDQTLWVTDSCTGMLVELRRGAQ